LSFVCVCYFHRVARRLECMMMYSTLTGTVVVESPLYVSIVIETRSCHEPIRDSNLPLATTYWYLVALCLLSSSSFSTCAALLVVAFHY